MYAMKPDDSLQGDSYWKKRYDLLCEKCESSGKIEIYSEDSLILNAHVRAMVSNHILWRKHDYNLRDQVGILLQCLYNNDGQINIELFQKKYFDLWNTENLLQLLESDVEKLQTNVDLHFPSLASAKALPNPEVSFKLLPTEDLSAKTKNGLPEDFNVYGCTETENNMDLPPLQFASKAQPDYTLCYEENMYAVDTISQMKSPIKNWRDELSVKKKGRVSPDELYFAHDSSMNN